MQLKGDNIQNIKIFNTFLFLNVFLKPDVEHEKPIIPEVIISAIDIGIPYSDAIAKKVPPVKFTDTALIKESDVILVAIFSIMAPPNTRAPRAMKKPDIRAASPAVIKFRPTIGAAALAALFAPAKRARKHAEEITKILSDKFIFCVLLPSRFISLSTILK